MRSRKARREESLDAPETVRPEARAAVADPEPGLGRHVRLAPAPVELHLADQVVVGVGAVERGRAQARSPSFWAPIRSPMSDTCAKWLPVVVDPSHSVGKALYVPACALAAVAYGADGLCIEAHVEPAKGIEPLTYALRERRSAD